MTTSMKAIQLHQIGGADLLRQEEVPIPIPTADQVLVRVAATAITPTELSWFPTFHTPDGSPRPLPIVLGHEFSGVVERVGPACRGLQAGEPVYGLNDWYRNGAQAEFCYPARQYCAQAAHP